MWLAKPSTLLKALLVLIALPPGGRPAGRAGVHAEAEDPRHEDVLWGIRDERPVRHEEEVREGGSDVGPVHPCLTSPRPKNERQADEGATRKGVSGIRQQVAIGVQLKRILSRYPLRTWSVAATIETRLRKDYRGLAEFFRGWHSHLVLLKTWTASYANVRVLATYAAEAVLFHGCTWRQAA